MRIVIALLLIVVLGLTYGSLFAADKLPDPDFTMYAPLAMAGHTQTPLPTATEAPEEIIEDPIEAFPTETPIAIPPLVDVVIRGADIPYGWIVKSDTYLPFNHPDNVAKYFAHYSAMGSELLRFVSQGDTYTSAQAAQTQVNVACEKELNDSAHPGQRVNWPQIGDHSCAIYYASGVRHARAKGSVEMFASFGAARFRILMDYDTQDPDLIFAQECIELMAQRAGFGVTGTCDLHVYDN